ncbi:MAG: cellulase family glycosylhydrolase [Dysgonamonadaceae bacterium]|jgi:endoglucanase|nr:cellulase family glycosylhydrolase [Dysgonamonadaceae bacterium]
MKNLIVFLSCFFAVLNLNAAKINENWRIAAASDIVEQTAAQELQRGLAERFNLSLQIIQPSDKIVAKTIYIGTPASLGKLVKFLKINKFDDEESYHAVFCKDAFFIVGASPKGAMNGVFRLLEQNTLEITKLNLTESPAFHYRVGGNLINQHPYPEWTLEDQARYYSSHYINILWGEKLLPPLPLDIRQKYGLGVMIEVRFPPEGKAWLDKPEHAPAVFELKDENGKRQRRAISPFDPQGREAYLKNFKRVLSENPDTKVLYGAFADYNTIPDKNYTNESTGEPYQYSRADGMREILKLMKLAVNEFTVNSQLKIDVAVWLWHSFFGDPVGEEKFMLELAEQGIGVIYNEAGNNDCWLTNRDNFIETALRKNANGEFLWGDKYMPIVSAGGACETTGSAIALPLPAVAAYKMSRLAQAGAKHFILWWGGVEGWTYNANMEVIAQMIWTPDKFDYHKPAFPANANDLLAQIARRDFGEYAGDVLEFWRLMDKALVWNKNPQLKSGLQPFDWFQRMAIFVRPYTEFGNAYKAPLIPSELEKRNELKSGKLWLYKPEAERNYRQVTGDLQIAINHLQSTINKIKINNNSSFFIPHSSLKDMLQWSDFLRHLMISQLNFNRACNAMMKNKDNEADLRNALLPIIADEIANDRSFIALLQEMNSWTGVTLGTSAVPKQSEPRVPAEIEMLEGKMAKMQAWADFGQLSVNGSALVNERGDTIVLKGVSLSWHNWWSKYYEAETVNWLKKDWNINLIRASISVENENGFIKNPEMAMKCLANVVDAAIKNNIYVIIDWHTHRFYPGEAKAFFTQVAEKYGKYPNIIYEIFNEPLDKPSWQQVKNYAVELIETIRAIDKKNIILVGSPHWSQDVDLAADNPVTGYENIMYSFHFYAATHRDDIRKRVNYAISKGLPVFVAECGGMEAVNGGGNIDYGQWNEWVKLMNDNRLSFAAWCIANKNETCSMIKNQTEKIADWKESDLTEWGVVIRNLLK